MLWLTNDTETASSKTNISKVLVDPLMTREHPLIYAPNNGNGYDMETPKKGTEIWCRRSKVTKTFRLAGRHQTWELTCQVNTKHGRFHHRQTPNTVVLVVWSHQTWAPFWKRDIRDNFIFIYRQLILNCEKSDGLKTKFLTFRWISLPSCRHSHGRKVSIVHAHTPSFRP